MYGGFESDEKRTQNMTPGRTLRVGLIGGGGIAPHHIRAYIENPHVADVYVADTSHEVGTRLAEEFGIVKKTFTDYQELIADESVDLADICLPHHLHHPAALAALAAGKDVIVEKPPALTLAEFDEMIRAADVAGCKLFIALCQRMFPAHQRAKKLLEADEIGRPFLATVTVLGNEMGRLNDPASWKGTYEKAGGGAMFDTGFHAVYMLQHFFGPATAATAVTKRLVATAENKADDTAMAALELPDGVLGAITVTYAATGSPWEEERRLIGTDGIILIRDDPEDEMPLVVMRESAFFPVKVHRPGQTNPWAIARTLDHFIDCIITDTAPEITLPEARDALATMLAIYQSGREEKKVPIGL